VKQKNLGFTLIELVMAIAVSALVLTAAMTSFTSFLQTRVDIQLQRQLQHEVVHAMQIMTDFVRDMSVQEVTNEGFTTGDYEFLVQEDILLLNSQPLFSPIFTVEDVTFSSPEDIHPRLELSFTVRHELLENIQVPVTHTISTRTYQF